MIDSETSYASSVLHHRVHNSPEVSIDFFLRANAGPEKNDIRARNSPSQQRQNRVRCVRVHHQETFCEADRKSDAGAAVDEVVEGRGHCRRVTNEEPVIEIPEGVELFQSCLDFGGGLVPEMAQSECIEDGAKGVTLVDTFC